MFNSIPQDVMQAPKTTAKPPSSSTNSKKKSTAEDERTLQFLEKATEDRIKQLLKYLKRYGVPDNYLFGVNDLKDMTNIPKVTRCIAMLGKMVSYYIKNIQGDQIWSF